MFQTYCKVRSIRVTHSVTSSYQFEITEEEPREPNPHRWIWILLLIGIVMFAYAIGYTTLASIMINVVFLFLGRLFL